MSISLIVQSRSRKVMRRITAGLDGLGDLAMRAPDEYLIRGIDPYDDTVFNLVQLRVLVQQLDRLAADMPDQTRLLQIVKEAAEEAISIGGYLRFIGD